MIHNRLRPLLAIIALLSVSPLISMDDPKIPTISFKDKTREELNRFAIEHEVHLLTPRSKQSLKEKIKELGIDLNSGDLIYTASASDGETPIRPGDFIKFVTVKQYYAYYKQMPPDSYRPIIVINANSREAEESMLSDILGPNGVACAYPDAPTVSYGPGVQPHNAVQISGEDFGLSALFQECNLE